jgi:hypothetical protein
MFSVSVPTLLCSISWHFLRYHTLKYCFLDFWGSLYRTNRWREFIRSILTWSNRQVTFLATIWGQLFVKLVWSTRGKLSHDVRLSCYHITTTTHGLNVGLVSRSASFPFRGLLSLATSPSLKVSVTQVLPLLWFSVIQIAVLSNSGFDLQSFFVQPLPSWLVFQEAFFFSNILAAMHNSCC